jgi:hypothetical protein
MALRPLIREKDKQVRERAIIKSKERLNGKIGAGRGNTKALTEKQVKKIIEDVEIEVRNEEIEKIRHVIGDRVDFIFPFPLTTIEVLGFGT